MLISFQVPDSDAQNMEEWDVVEPSVQDQHHKVGEFIHEARSPGKKSWAEYIVEYLLNTPLSSSLLFKTMVEVREGFALET